ncbi:hypothetical protein GCK32_000318 [Trichostrongylus colubriformis]|uniref:Uncharacterized protein n=1 Tax=Trichostrongylus colubriformis TaxID=6319 RepID=A0AAN8IBZ7_TRICO
MILPAYHVPITSVFFITPPVQYKDHLWMRNLTGEFGSYKYIHYARFVVFSALYSIVNMGLLPAIHIHKRSFLMISTRSEFLQPHIGRVQKRLYCSIFAQSLFLLAVHCTYRCLHIVK